MSSFPPGDRTEPCPSCGVLLQVEGLPLFQRVLCPGCGEEVIVRTRSGRYRLVDVLGEGGAGKVFGADSESRGEIALKVLDRGHPEYQEHLALLHNEASMPALVDHPRIVKILFMEEDAEGARLGMEWMRGGSLHEYIDAHGSLGETEALSLILQTLEGLAASHSRGIIHRDIKPANILLSGTNGAKLSDFGLALGSGAAPVHRTHLLATPDYVAPEILGGSRGDVASDLYSLGGCLYHALTGFPPHLTEGLSLEELSVIKAEPVRFPQGRCSKGTATLVEKMLHPDPAARFFDDGALRAEISSLLDALVARKKGFSWGWIRSFMGGS